LKLRIAVSGSSGYLARNLITRLGAGADCEFILGLDIRPHEVDTACPSFFVCFALTQSWVELQDLFQSYRINAGLHLAWQFNPIHNVARERDIDVEGSRNFFRAAQAAGLKKVVYASSSAAYVHPGNPSQPPFLTEETPVSGTPSYSYSLYKAEVDRMAQAFMKQQPDIQMTILRPCIVLGPHTQNIVTKVFDWPFRSFPWAFQVGSANPPMQFLSEDDINEILYRAVKSDVSGIFNAVPDGVVHFRDVARAAGRGLLRLPAWVLYLLTDILWELHLAPFPGGLLDMTRYAWVADNTRLKTVLGYTPRLDSKQTLDLFATSRRPRKDTGVARRTGVSSSAGAPKAIGRGGGAHNSRSDM